GGMWLNDVVPVGNCYVWRRSLCVGQWPVWRRHAVQSVHQRVRLSACASEIPRRRCAGYSEAFAVGSMPGFAPAETTVALTDQMRGLFQEAWRAKLYLPGQPAAEPG